MDCAFKNKNGDDVLNELAAKRESKSLLYKINTYTAYIIYIIILINFLETKAVVETSEEGGLLMSMLTKKIKKNLDEVENKETLDSMKKDKLLGDLEKLLMQGALNLQQ